MDYNLLSIIKKEKERLLEDKNDNYSRLSCDVPAKVENGFDNCLQNSVLSNNQQETFNYDNFKEEKQSCSVCSENFINSYSLYKHNLIHLKVPLVGRKLFICDVCSNFYETKKQLQHHITTAHEDKTLYNRTNSLKSLYKCEVCKKVLKYKTWFDHKKICHEQTKVQCDKCNKLFKYTCTLKRHILTAHKGVKPPQRTFQCPKCPKILNKNYLKIHLKILHSEGTFQCKICKSVFKCKMYLLAHMRTVHDDNGMLHHCDICGKSFKSPSKVKRHKRRSHTYQEGMAVQCPKCLKILKSKSYLTAHIKSCHSEGTFQCKICKSVFKCKMYLLAHMRTVHDDNEMLHHCDICGKSFKSPSKVKRHKRRSHTYQEGMAVQCPKCLKILKSKSYLTAHIKSCHSEGTFQCKICKSVFKCKRYLSDHMGRVHDDDGMLHHCDICGKSFKSPSKVKMHKEYCQKTVQCPKCPKILNKSYLKKHLKSCHSEGSFQCKICKSVFKSKPYLSSHMRSVHDVTVLATTTSIDRRVC